MRRTQRRRSERPERRVAREGSISLSSTGQNTHPAACRPPQLRPRRKVRFAARLSSSGQGFPCRQSGGMPVRACSRQGCELTWLPWSRDSLSPRVVAARHEGAQPPASGGEGGGRPGGFRRVRFACCYCCYYFDRPTKIVVINLAAGLPQGAKAAAFQRCKGQGGDETRGEVCNAPRFYGRAFFLALPLHAALPSPLSGLRPAPSGGTGRPGRPRPTGPRGQCSPACRAAQRLSRTRAMQLGHQKSFANVTQDSKRTRGLPRRYPRARNQLRAEGQPRSRQTNEGPASRPVRYR